MDSYGLTIYLPYINHTFNHILIITNHHGLTCLEQGVRSMVKPLIFFRLDDLDDLGDLALPSSFFPVVLWVYKLHEVCRPIYHQRK